MNHPQSMQCRPSYMYEPSTTRAGQTHEGPLSRPWMLYGFSKTELFRSFGMGVHDKGFVSECYCVSDFIPQSVISSICFTRFLSLAILILEHEDLFWLYNIYFRRTPCKTWRSGRRRFTMFAFLRLGAVRRMFSMSAGHKSNVQPFCGM